MRNKYVVLGKKITLYIKKGNQNTICAKIALAKTWPHEINEGSSKISVMRSVVTRLVFG